MMKLDEYATFIRKKLIECIIQNPNFKSIGYKDFCYQVLHEEDDCASYRDPDFHDALGEINIYEAELHNRPMLTCILVHSDDKYNPGIGFFEHVEQIRHISIKNKSMEAKRIYVKQEQENTIKFWRNKENKKYI